MDMSWHATAALVHWLSTRSFPIELIYTLIFQDIQGSRNAGEVPCKSLCCFVIRHSEVVHGTGWDCRVRSVLAHASALP